MALIDLEAASARVFQVLATALPDQQVKLLALTDHGGNPQARFVFRVSPAAGGSLIAKLAADPETLMPQARRMIASAARMRSGPLRVPQVLHHDAALGVILMEDGWGQQAATLWGKGGPAALQAMQAAGRWLARFHGLTARQAPFSVRPHLNWLDRALSAQAAGSRAIPDFAALTPHLDRLHRLAGAADGLPARRCITHRDFHLRNLLIRPNGRVYGLDFENERLDDAVRDTLFLLTDARVRSTRPDEFAACVSAFHAAYGPPPAPPEVAQFFHLFQALSAWAALDESTAPLGPNRLRRLRVLQQLAVGEGLLLSA